MSDIAASEQRLIAALDRIDRSLDASAARRAAAPDAATDAALGSGLMAVADAEVARLTAELAALREVRAADIAQMEGMLSTIEGLLADEQAPAQPAGQDDTATPSAEAPAAPSEAQSDPKPSAQSDAQSGTAGVQPDVEGR